MTHWNNTIFSTNYSLTLGGGRKDILRFSTNCLGQTYLVYAWGSSEQSR
jgi:hypothetical protein